MATPQELLAVIKQIESSTGDVNAWMRGLSADEVATASRLSASPAELDAVIARIRANHPTVFASQPEEQQGEAATAMKKAEDSLALQNSSTAQLDLLVVSAILGAHATTREGSEALRALQREIEDAVQTRTDLDTPAGARDFQRFLIGKLRQIGAVVETANLDDRSKAGLAGAWTALYESTRYESTRHESTPDESTRSESTPPAENSPVPAPLPAYGTDLGAPLAEPWLPADPALMTAPVTAPPAAAPVQPQAATAPPAMPTLPTMPGLPLGGGLPSAASLPLPRWDDDAGAASPSPRSEPSGLGLDELLGDDEVMADLEADAAEDTEPEGAETDTTKSDPEPAEPVAPSTTVRLPNGDTVTAQSPQLAKAITAALDGTPIGAAYAQQGIPIPPPGTAVPDPVEPADLVTGDIGMFTDRQALALDRDRALFNGQIQPVAGVSGPSFLGWLHPPDPVTTGPAAPSATTPNGAAAPPPTRPASAAGYAR